MMDLELQLQVKQAIERLYQDLGREKGSSSHWTGELSTSALSTATAVSALSACVDRMKSRNTRVSLPPSSEPLDQERLTMERLIENGSRWLSEAQNEDGGFGDTNRSLSNIATTLLVLAAWQLAGHNSRYARQIGAAWSYVERQGGWDGLRQRYGKDKTFVVPILTNCAISGLVDWGQIPTLPFEAAALPQSWYRFAKMPVVSYAVPALVAIGQAQHFHQRRRNPILRWIRSLCIEPTRRVLTQMQPTSGGYLEAVPLTSFVLMSLASMGQIELRVAVEARKFIIDSVLPDGSWPIDTNLATWVTSLASTAFFDVDRERPKTNLEWERNIDWLLSCQHVRRHPFTGADPGGWGWTNLSGAVPDADDTPAALIALKHWYDAHSGAIETGNLLAESRLERVLNAAAMGCRWLLKLQNSDGGWPTFCRGWGTLPFDRSGSDLTAHAMRALNVWSSVVSQPSNKTQHSVSSDRIRQATERGWSYLLKNQQADGSWLPLWFGNQDRLEEDNPVYGTGRVLKCFSQCNRSDSQAFRQGVHFLISCQNRDGGWGGGDSIHYPARPGNSGTIGKTGGSSTIEETAIALDGIMHQIDTTEHSDSIMAGLRRLSEFVLAGDHHTSQPIGFYFAKLWYHERLYPMVFSLSALKKGLEICQR